jgi:uncharacterized protein YcbK (DUF882 family)
VVPHFRHKPLLNSGLIKVGHDHRLLNSGPATPYRGRQAFEISDRSIQGRPEHLRCDRVVLHIRRNRPTGPAEAREGNRTLKLYFGHTKERGEFTFKRNGRYDKAELKRINHLLRDWRKNEDANLDPKLLDLVWSIYKEAGGRDYIHVVSAYRSLKTNNMLRSRSKGVAKTSQHTAGKAMDFYIPGVPLAKLRATAMKFQGGGVGYYPTSGSPFVHVDTGSVRSWPRMTRKQLLALFPNGETLYLPADGKPLPGYERAVARRKSSGGTALAYLESGPDETAGAGRAMSRVG